MRLVTKQTFTLERRRRLSDSMLWKLQRNYFRQAGIKAWRNGTVPHHITSNPYIADAYARIVSNYLRDCLAAVDLEHPIYVVELGSGSGRFAYLFLKTFLASQPDSLLKDVSIKYVTTDFTEQNLEYWRRHPRFQRFIEEGLIDFARFDVEHDRKLKLIHSGDTITAKNLRNPLVVIANYMFDSIPQDAFFVSGNELFETLVTLTTPKKETDPNDPKILSRVDLSYDYNRVNGPYYEEANWNRILGDYKKRLPDTAFLFPTTALQGIRNLHRLSRGRMLLLSGDRGYSSDEALREGQGAPAIAVHGSISMMVDYQIIGEYCRRLGGQALHPRHLARSLNISAFMFGDTASNFSETRQAYAEAIEKFGPDDFFTLKEGIAGIYDALTLDQILAFLRLSCWDYKRFWECLPVIKKHLPVMTGLQKRALHEAIVKVWDSYLPIGEESDLAFELGTLLVEMEFYEAALDFLHRSVDLHGLAPGTAYNIAVCYYSLNQMDRALDHVNQALGLDHEFTEARTLRRQLESGHSSTSRKTRQKRRA